MAEVLLFHHAQGLTPGVVAFADEIRRAGHAVHTPDLFDGRVFATLDEGLAYAREVGFDRLREDGVRAADGLPADLVHAGFSLGGMPAQQLAQSRPGRGGGGGAPPPPPPRRGGPRAPPPPPPGPPQRTPRPPPHRVQAAPQ